MKVALFFDGKNFYTALTKFDSVLEIDYNKLAEWLTGKASSGKGEFVGAYYYTGYTPTGQGGGAEFGDFLKGLELQLGYFVKREPRVRRKATCRKCRFTYKYGAEKRVDTRLVADMIKFAAVDAYDVAVLLSGDQDFVPAVEAANALGKRVYIAAWPQSGVSRELRVRCYDQIHLESGVPDFSTGRPRKHRSAHEDLIQSNHDPETNMLMEIGRAHERHEYLSRGHFINKWRPQLDIPESGAAREEMLDTLIAEGKVVEHTRELDGHSFKALKVATE